MQLNVPIPDQQAAVRLPAGVFQWTEEEFFCFCQANRDLRIERSAKGEIIVMSPAGGYAGYRSGEVFRQLSTWAVNEKSGLAFNSSTGFRLPNGAMRAPDAAWVRLERLQGLTLQEKEHFIPLCPDFVVELASPSDALSRYREKMNEYLSCGLALGWLIVPASTQVEIYTSLGLKVLTTPETVSADPTLAGLRLELSSVWHPPF